MCFECKKYKIVNWIDNSYPLKYKETHNNDIFLQKVKNYFEDKLKCELIPAFPVRIGFVRKKIHKFDLGNEDYLIECKEYSWTGTGSIPSAKIDHLDQAILLLAKRSVTKNWFSKSKFIPQSKKLMQSIIFI